MSKDVKNQIRESVKSLTDNGKHITVIAAVGGSRETYLKDIQIYSHKGERYYPFAINDVLAALCAEPYSSEIIEKKIELAEKVIQLSESQDYSLGALNVESPHEIFTLIRAIRVLAPETSPENRAQAILDLRQDKKPVNNDQVDALLGLIADGHLVPPTN